MVKTELLTMLKAFIEESTADLLFRVSVQRGDVFSEDRPPAVYLMRLPDTESYTKKAPYIIIQAVTGNDEQPSGDTVQSECGVRLVFCVYDEDGQQGSMRLLEVMERVRIALLRRPVIGKRYQLDLQQKLQMLVYTDDIYPYYGGEIYTVWRMPSPDREIPGLNYLG